MDTFVVTGVKFGAAGDSLLYIVKAETWIGAICHVGRLIGAKHATIGRDEHEVLLGRGTTVEDATAVLLETKDVEVDFWKVGAVRVNEYAYDVNLREAVVW